MSDTQPAYRSTRNSLCDLTLNHQAPNLVFLGLHFLAAGRSRAQRHSRLVVLARYHDGLPGGKEVVGEDGVCSA